MESIPPSLPSVPPSPEVASTPRGAGAVRVTPESDFKQVLQRLASHVDEGEKLVRQVTAPGAGGEGAALLALQAGIYRYTEVVDLSAKLVDRASSSVKTTLQSQ